MIQEVDVCNFDLKVGGEKKPLKNEMLNGTVNKHHIKTAT